MKFNRMTKKAVAATGAVAFAMTMVAGGAVAEEEDGEKRIKCFGIVAKGQNDCATSTHSCAAQAKVDNHPEEWKYMVQGECEKLGGSVGKPKE